ncbi:hypothetical protein QE152_g25261 [Popillia japonica]|uniref:Uncharacterized protein n=1 Tax=Popillia japonica TaxID=7064 RepID=A0AAW1K1L1_POPJA
MVESCLTETWLKVAHLDHVQLDNYFLACYFCRSSCIIGGGVGIYVRKGIEVTAMDFTNYECEKEFEVCLAVASVSMFEKTRVTATAATGIDNIFTSVSKEQYYASVHDTYLSDHRSINLRVQLKNNNINSHQWTVRRIFDASNKSNFEYYLSLETWDDVFHAPDVNSKFYAFTNILSYHFNNAFPLRRQLLQAGSKHWITREVKTSSQALQDLFVLQKSYPELKELYISAKKRHKDLTNNTKRSFYDNIQKSYPELKELYISAKKRHKDLTNNTKRSFYDNIINNAANKSSAMWKVVRWNTNNRKQFSNITLLENDELVTDTAKIVNNFNKFFQTAATNNHDGRNNVHASFYQG